MNRYRRNIFTARAELYVGVTELRKPGQGSVELTGGSSGTVATLTVDGVAIISAAVSFDTDLATTALRLAEAINDKISSPNYWAKAVGAKVYIWEAVPTTGTLTVASTVTGTLTKTDTDVSGGALGDGTPLGFTDTGLDLEIGDEYVRETVEESGARIAKWYAAGENVRARIVLRQFDADALAVRFPNRFSTTNGAARIELPGTMLEGDDLSSVAKTFVLVPDSTLHPTVLIRKGIVTGTAAEPLRFRTQQSLRTAIEIECDRDDAIGSADGRYPYRTVGVDLAQFLTL